MSTNLTVDLAPSPIRETNLEAGTGVLFENRYVTVHTVPSRFGPFNVVQAGTGSGAAILAVRDDHVLMVRQPRYATGQHHWELPRGGSRAGEDLAAAAVRETLEETGQTVEAADLWALGVVNPDTGLLNTEVGLFLADLHSLDAPAIADSVEVDDVAWVPVDQLIEACANGAIADAFTCIAVLRARLRDLI